MSREGKAARALRDWCAERYVDSSREFGELYGISEMMDREVLGLRELVRDMWMCIDNRHGCEECYEECYGMGAMETNGETGEIHCNQHFAAMMRKLGIEV